MSPVIKVLLGAALTLPLVAFVAGVLTTPERVDEDRSRPVIIGRVSDAPPVSDDDPVTGRRADAGDGDDAPQDGAPDGQDDDDPTDRADTYRVVVPPPRGVDHDDDDGDDDGDDADADHSEDGSGGGSDDASGGG